ncbi:unnamed protein product [Soboliphyme baturini]|uniref:Gamma-aminobutyric acid receptor subunit beta n=1 Tax=Soboliphyme baturini TaxID=241478 RepID=A0A183IJA9_9BILA|nr:unnamed protein product [Soboliphyme baturini]
MALHLFPLDSQECTLEIESYGYSEADTKYRWIGDAKPVTMDEVSLPQFYVAHFSVRGRTITLTTGDYSRLNVKFVFVRNIGFYLMQIYIPSMLIVIISWVSFWIHRDASPARVALGVTTVLTMTTLMTTTNASLPKVSYIKAIDIYLGTSFVMVFASLLEYAAVSYLNKKMKMKRERKKQKDAQSQEFAILPNQPPRRQMSVSAVAVVGTAEASFYPYISNKAQRDYQRLVAGNLSPPGSHFECECDVSFQPIPMKITKPRLRRRKLHNVTPSSIDKYSRMLFPVIFAIFNIIYWIVYGYSDADIKLFWERGKDSVTIGDEIRQLSNFDLVDVYIVERKITLSTGVYSRLSCHFKFSRNIGYYWVQIYQPSIMVVILSWVSFWINRDSAPARVTLGIMTVLTMTTLITTTNNQLPKVSYMKAVDIFLGFCYLMVFSALLEYAVVSYKVKKENDFRKKRAIESTQVQSATSPVPPRTATESLARRRIPPVAAKQTSGQCPDVIAQYQLSAAEAIPGDRRASNIATTSREEEPPPIYPRFQPVSPKLLKRSKLRTRNHFIWKSSSVDKHSRVVFPIIFLIFNILYWSILCKKSGKI